MALIDDVLFYAKQIADDNRFRYRYQNEGNGAGPIEIPYAMDCCTYISYCIYLAMGWTWHNQPYGYYWPHVSEAGFDYFLVNTMDCQKFTWPNVPGGLQPGDIIITSEALGHTLIMYTTDTIADANNYFGYGAESIAIRPYPTYGTNNWYYIYRLPGGSGASDLFKRAPVSDSVYSDVTFRWTTLTDPYSCAVAGTATQDRENIIWKTTLANTPFVFGDKYRLKYSSESVYFVIEYYNSNNWTDPAAKIGEVSTLTSVDFMIPTNCTHVIFKLLVKNGTTVNETVYPQIYLIQDMPSPPPDIDGTHKMPLWMMLHPFI